MINLVQNNQFTSAVELKMASGLRPHIKKLAFKHISGSKRIIAGVLTGLRFGIELCPSETRDLLIYNTESILMLFSLDLMTQEQWIHRIMKLEIKTPLNMNIKMLADRIWKLRSDLEISRRYTTNPLIIPNPLPETSNLIELNDFIHKLLEETRLKSRFAKQVGQIKKVLLRESVTDEVVQQAWAIVVAKMVTES